MKVSTVICVIWSAILIVMSSLASRHATDIATMPVNLVIAGISGLAGLPSVMAAVCSGQTIAIANKESLVSQQGPL